MYLKTPKRYLRGQKRSPISLRWLWLWLLTPLVVFAGIQLYERREEFRPPIEQALNSALNNAQSGLATIAAPTPLPTQDPTILIARADNNWREGRVESALEDYAVAMGGAPNNVQIFYRATLALIGEDRDAQALEMAENTVTANPFSADAWAIRSFALSESGRYGEALASALRAVELDSNNARAYAYLAEAYWNLGRGELALENAERALSIDPDSYEAYRIRGWINQTVQFDLAAAEQDFRAARDLAPNLPQQTVDLAQLIANYEATATENPAETAIALLTETLELNPDNPRVLFWLGNIAFRRLGQREQAADYLSRCVEAQPESIRCLALLGRVQEALENYNGAVDNLQRAVDLGSTDPLHLLWLGRSYVALGSCGSAIPPMQTGYDLAREQGNTEALTVLAELLSQCQAPVIEAAPPVDVPAPEATTEPNAG
jgi:tetratricopeptide (TPR) repeat protein